MSNTGTETSTPQYRIGDADTECRYPVFVGHQVIGQVFRWHRDWLVNSSAGEQNLGRPDEGTRGADMAAAHLAREYAAGTITAAPLAEASTRAPLEYGPVPLLHPRMPAKSRRNRDGALKAFAGLTAHHWTARHGFPGSDNPWHMACDLCGWSGVRYWSHLRGRNGQPPSISRHPGGCISPAEIRALIAAYRQ